MTGLPWYGDKGRRLMHIGISYPYQNRHEADTDSRVKFSARAGKLPHEPAFGEHPILFR